MPLRRCSSPLALTVALTLAGCGEKQKQTPTPDPVASAVPPSAAAIATASATTTPPSPAAPTATFTKVELTPRGGTVAYVQLTHPNTHAADVLNRLFKKEADKAAAEIAAGVNPGITQRHDCEGGLPAQDILWLSCSTSTAYENRSAPYGYIENQVWSLADKEPARLQLSAQLTGNWIAAADAWCQVQFKDSTFGQQGEVISVADLLREKPNWRPQREALVLTFTQGLTGPIGDGIPECKVPWDKLASFLRPDSPLRPIADKAPPSPPPPPPPRLEDGPLLPPPANPGRQPRDLPPPLSAQQTACDGGDRPACVKVGEALMAGKDVTEDVDLAAWIFHTACEAGEPTGCVNLAWGYLNSTSSAPGAAAAPYFAKACNDKATLGCFGLATLYRDGRGTAKNPERAAELFKQACDGGVKVACSQLKNGPGTGRKP